jgi:hypothetical protein
LATGGDLNNPPRVFLNPRGTHIAIALGVMKNEYESRYDTNKNQQNEAPTKSVRTRPRQTRFSFLQCPHLLIPLTSSRKNTPRLGDRQGNRERRTLAEFRAHAEFAAEKLGKLFRNVKP